nr:ABC transporter substrate-binding protein [uncultured Ruminococcus sp.]
MKRTLSVLLALCLLMSCALFAGCSNNGSSDNFPVTVGEVTIDKEPVSVVVLSDKLADIISYIGYDIKMVGRSEECDQDFLKVVPTVGKASAPDVNAITAAGADLVIADGYLAADARQSIESAGVKVLVLNPATNKEELEALYTDLGTALGGKTTGAEKGKKGYNTLFDTLETLNTVSTGVVQTAAYLYINEAGQLCTFPAGSLEQTFFNYSGTSNVFISQTEPVVQAEYLRIESPTYLFVDSPDVLQVLQADPSLAGINAIVNGHTLVIPKINFERHGSSVEQAVFDILSYIEKISKGTPDEATAAATEATTEAATEEATDAAAAEATEEATASADDAAALAAADGGTY